MHCDTGDTNYCTVTQRTASGERLKKKNVTSWDLTPSI